MKIFGWGIYFPKPGGMIVTSPKEKKKKGKGK